jgi:mannitol/fructose-specific phosphotransferase system IIA component (Ntr-type)
MLSDHLTEETVVFAEAADWREAVETAAAPLVERGSVRPEYVQKILENIEAPGGTYMDLGFGVTLAHARPEAGVDATGLSLLVLDRPVDLADDPAHPAKLVFVLAATDTTAHQSTMAELAKLLVDKDARDALTAATGYGDVLRAIEGSES